MAEQKRDDDGRDSSIGVIDRPEVKDREKVERPPMYQVILLNDDFTPFEFVVEVLVTVFAMDEAKAVRVMLSVHNNGRGTCGIYTREVAETKCAQVVDLAKARGHPLQCTVEKE